MRRQQEWDAPVSVHSKAICEITLCSKRLSLPEVSVEAAVGVGLGGRAGGVSPRSGVEGVSHALAEAYQATSALYGTVRLTEGCCSRRVRHPKPAGMHANDSAEVET